MSTPINKYCPKSGKAVQADCLADYRGFKVGFCNPKCRDAFAADTESPSASKSYFDALIQESS